MSQDQHTYANRNTTLAAAENRNGKITTAKLKHSAARTRRAKRPRSDTLTLVTLGSVTLTLGHFHPLDHGLADESGPKCNSALTSMGLEHPWTRPGDY
mgnify:CR=1 FL=1